MATSPLRSSERFGSYLISFWRYVMAVICGACAEAVVDGLKSLAHLLRIHRLDVDLSSLPLLLLCVVVLVAILVGSLRFSGAHYRSSAEGRLYGRISGRSFCERLFLHRRVLVTVEPSSPPIGARHRLHSRLDVRPSTPRRLQNLAFIAQCCKRIPAMNKYCFPPRSRSAMQE